MFSITILFHMGGPTVILFYNSIFYSCPTSIFSIMGFNKIFNNGERRIWKYIYKCACKWVWTLVWKGPRGS